jgi:hypothetical protein
MAALAGGNRLAQSRDDPDPALLDVPVAARALQPRTGTVHRAQDRATSHTRGGRRDRCGVGSVRLHARTSSTLAGRRCARVRGLGADAPRNLTRISWVALASRCPERGRHDGDGDGDGDRSSVSVGAAHGGRSAPRGAVIRSWSQRVHRRLGRIAAPWHPRRHESLASHVVGGVPDAPRAVRLYFGA